MSWLMRSLFRQFRHWERSAQLGLVLAAALGAVALLAARYGPSGLRTPAIVGFMGLVLVAQGIFLWANRGMVTPFTRAQRHYLKGEFDVARSILEEEVAHARGDVRSLTLLGNIYRQLGDLQKSESILYEALNINPDHYFPLYAIGRTLLAGGHYAQAQDAVERALKNGAAPQIRADLGEIYYRQGAVEQAAAEMRAAMPHIGDEPHRLLMAAYVLYRAGSGHSLAAEQCRAGLPYWEAQAALFRATPYGDSLSRDIETIKTLIKEI